MPGISRKSLSEHREHIREALFAVLSSLMATRNFNAISMNDLANKSGIGRTAIYNHFSDKEELLLAYIEFEVNAYIDRINSKLARTDSPLNRLRAYAREQILAKHDYFLSPGAPLRDVVSRKTAVALCEHVSVTGGLSRQILDECIEAGATPDQNLDVTVQLLRGALTGHRIPEDEPTRSAFLDAVDRFALRSAGASVPDDFASLSH